MRRKQIDADTQDGLAVGTVKRNSLPRNAGDFRYLYPLHMRYANRFGTFGTFAIV